MRTTITIFNGRISTEGLVNKHADEWHVAIIQNYSDGDFEVLQARDYKTIEGAQRYIEQYRARKQDAFNRGELVAGVKVL